MEADKNPLIDIGACKLSFHSVGECYSLACFLITEPTPYKGKPYLCPDLDLILSSISTNPSCRLNSFNQ